MGAAVEWSGEMLEEAESPAQKTEVWPALVCPYRYSDETIYSRPLESEGRLVMIRP